MAFRLSQSDKTLTERERKTEKDRRKDGETERAGGYFEP